MADIRKVTSAMAIVTLLPHLFCCVIPLVMSVVGFGASLGLFTLNSSGFEWLIEYEPHMMAVAGVMLLVGAAVQLISWRIDCRKEYCTHEPCEPKKKRSLNLFYLASALYVVSLLIHIFADIH